jgi:hypothetical protein
MSSDDDERPPQQLLKPGTHFQLSSSQMASSRMSTHESATPRKPYQIIFSTRDEEIQYTEKLMDNCATYDGTPEQLMDWLKETGACIAKEKYPETDHPFIIRHLLVDDALDYYLAHDDLVFNFSDLRKLLLHRHSVFASLRTLSSLDSIATLTLNPTSSFLTSTQLPPVPSTTSGNPQASTTFSFAQSLEDLTQNDIRKTIIEDLQRNSPKFTGDQQQDVIKWLKTLENKFETAGIPAAKKFDLVSQLLDKGALDWFQDTKSTFNHSWSEFVDHFKRTFDSPNRARIAMQKLHSYTQSPQQDVRSFCSEMRKLFQEADPQMSPTMKLELLLARVNPSYRLDLLKQKPKTSEEFETMAKDLENTYLVFAAIEQSTRSNAPFFTVASPETRPYSPSARPQSTSYNTSHSTNNNNNTTQNANTHTHNNNRYSNKARYNPRSPSNNTYSPRQFTPNSSSSSNQSPSRPPSDNRQTSGNHHPRPSSQQHLFAYQTPSATHQETSSSSDDLRPLMPPSTPVSAHPETRLPSSDPSITLICQWCSGSGHSARECPF